MITPIASIVRARRGAWAVAAPLLIVGALAAGCGSAHVSGASSQASGRVTAPAAPTASATPVPTVTGGSVVAGESACVGWPSSPPTATLPVSFVPVTVERCVNGAETVPGKGLWSTATLERSDGDLTGLISALRQTSAGRTPDTVCPELAVIPPQIVLISATGQQVIPRLPVSGCDLVQSRVLAALGVLRWDPVSVRLISPIEGSTATATAAPAVTGTPRSEQSVNPALPQ
jgi:hypothetical protein